MNEDENKLRKKWKYLRDQFSIEYGKIPVSRSDDRATASYEPKWPYYKSLLFLTDIVKARKTSGKLSKLLKRRTSSTSIENANDIQDYSSQDQDNSNRVRTDLNCDQYDLNDPNDIEANTNIDLPRDGNAFPRKRKLNTFNQSMLDIEREKLEYLQKKGNRNEDDEHTSILFFKSLLPHIRKIPQQRLLSFRNEIQRTVDFYAYQSQFPSHSTLSNHSPQSAASPSTHETPDTHASQVVGNTLLTTNYTSNTKPARHSI